MQKSLFDDNQESAELVTMDPSFVDRDYQARAIEGTFEAFDAGEPGAIIRAFTGAGKTYMGSRVAAEWLNRSGKNRVFVCAHERQLVAQFRDELAEFLGIPIGLEMSNDGDMSFGPQAPRVVVSCRATLLEDKHGTSRLYKFHRDEYNWLLLIDEGHRWAYSLPSCRHILEWFEANPQSKRLLLTATPERSDGVSLERIAPAVALDYPMFSATGPSAIEDGWAVPFDQKFIHVEGVDFENLKQVAGDFDRQELEQLLAEREQLMAMLQPLLDLSGDRQTLIFNVSRDMAKAVARAINAERSVNGAEHGGAEWLDGTIDDDVRRETFARHQRGEFQFLSVCGLCREGYNDPGIQCVAIFRPTKSSGLAEQMIGRGCRPLKGTVDGLATPAERRAAIAASAKPNCRIIDLVGASGLGQCATTAHLYAIGDDDVPDLELSQRANEILMEQSQEDDEPADVGEAIKKAKQEIAEEKERARLEREAKERRELERKEKEARLKARVNYQVSDSGSPSEVARPQGSATEKQIRAMLALGVSPEMAQSCSKRQASAVISKLRKRQEISSSSACGKFPQAPQGPATHKQLSVIAKHGHQADQGLTYQQAAEKIQQINQELERQTA